MKNRPGSRGKHRNNPPPLSAAEILARDNVPASKPVPPPIAERLARHRVFIASSDEHFDPRKGLTRVKGSKGTWELSTSQPIVSGLPVERTRRLPVGSMKRKSGTDSEVEPFRPAWQPHIYHPKAVAGDLHDRGLLGHR